MDYQSVSVGLTNILLLAGMVLVPVVYVLVLRKPLIPSPGLGWMVSESVASGDGIPSMVVIDCLCGGTRPSGGNEAVGSFTIRAEASDAARATIVRFPSADELPSKIAGRRAVVSVEGPGLWRVDAPLVRGSTLRIRLYGVEVGASPALLPVSDGIRIEPLDRKRLWRRAFDLLRSLFFLPFLLFSIVAPILDPALRTSPTAGDWLSLVLNALGGVCVVGGLAYALHEALWLHSWFKAHLAISGLSPSSEAELAHAQSA